MMLNLVVSLCTGWIAVNLFLLDVISGPRHRLWIVLPNYVRWGVRVSGAGFLLRSANLLTLLPSSPVGNVNLEAVGVTLALTYTITAVVAFYWARQMPPHAWDRLEWVRSVLLREPTAAPVFLTAAEVTKVAHGVGAAAVGPGQGGEAVVLEAARFGHRLQQQERRRAREVA